MYIAYLFSFFAVVLFSLFLWSDVNEKSKYGKRPFYLLSSIITMGTIGVFLIVVTVIGFYNKLAATEPELLFNTKTEYQSNLDNQEIPKELKGLFSDNCAFLSINTSVQVEKPGKEWLINDIKNNVQYRVKKTEMGLNIYKPCQPEIFNFLWVLQEGFNRFFSFAAFAIISTLYLICFFFLEYSIHCQRIHKSFLINNFKAKLKSFYTLIIPLFIIAVVSVVFFFLKDTLHMMDEIEQKGLFYGQKPLGIVSFVMLGFFSFFYILLNVNINRNIFNLQRGVIRKEELLFNSLIVINIICTFIFPILNGFGYNEPKRIFFIEIKYLPFELFTILNVIYAIRLYSEYFYQRILNQEKTIDKQQETMELKNELINLVLSSPVSDDINIIKSAVADSIDRSMRNLIVNEYRITGTYVLRRTENILKVDSGELIYEYCTPLVQVPGLNLKKQTKQQLNDLILRKAYDIDKIKKAQKDRLTDWGEQLIKEVMETGKEVIIDPIPKEFLGLQRYIGLFPIINMMRLDGIVVIFKDSFESLFPEEQNALKDLIDDLKVIFAITEGKRIQSERNRLQGEIDTAHRIQTSIIPRVIELKGYDAACFMETATEVGGDAYDVFPTEKGNYLGIGDVSGHGLAAGITALIQQAAFQSSIHTSLSTGKLVRPYEIYNIVNKVLCRLNSDRIGSDKFMTQNYFYENEGDFVFAGAHEIALLYDNKEEKVIQLKGCAKRTAFMGLSSLIDSITSEGTFRMEEDDILILYSDGIIEAKDHFSNQFGITNLSHILLTNNQLSASGLVNKIVTEVKKHAKEGDMKRYNGSLADDISLIVLKKKK
ncbi:MAG: serine/threonine-protein phosphatase [Spirochaetales bacterium]|nr:serine/threonine-protein phosphatase [Spirochaetales bacterium]